jgi:hypothetical protein
MSNLNFQVSGNPESFAVVGSGITDSYQQTSSVITEAASNLVEVGEEITVTALDPNPLGRSFIEWTEGPCAGSTNTSCTFTMTDDIKLNALYELNGGTEGGN